ncbi:hypothetical protein D9757_003500 [Collybiopsis confluens]|uniref:Uncharacterized protein n=1 Tax=Collybiopsis confluens TaxID=2823264 RepID=A0A8H5HU65_9AGAR|nr:hypothetical protein D9757_003500 [Collybiopsis confluens]
MSSASAPASSSTATVSQGSSPANQGNLYLFTFLSTLLVLLLISCSIVFRSFIIRRRYQRRLADALASGAIVPSAQGSRQKRFRARPKFFDSWISETANAMTWSDLMPLSVLPVKSKKKAKFQTEPEVSRNPQAGSVFSRLFTSYHLERGRDSSNSRVWRRSARSDDDSVPSSPVSPAVTAAPTQDNPEPTNTLLYRKNLVQVAILIAMPSPHKRSPTLSPLAEDEIPELAFGVARLHYKAKELDP